MVNRRNVNARKRRAAGSFLSQFLVGFLLLMILLLSGGVIWYGTRLEAFTIVEIKVDGGDTVSHESVRSLTEQELRGNYYKLVPKRFFWTYPKEKIEAKVKDMEKVKAVAVSLVDRQTVRVVIEEYEPAALWCGRGEGLENCIFLDAYGYAFTKAPPLVGTAMLRLYDNQTPEVGENPFTYDFIRDSTDFARYIRQDLSLIAASAEKIGSEEITYQITGGGQIKLTLRQSIEDSLENLEVLLSSPDFSHLAPGNFEYIDLRFGDKVFVNEVTGQPDQEVNATSSEETVL